MKQKPQRRTTEVPAYLNEICDTCIHATFDNKFHNLSIYGKPTLIICDLYPHPEFPKIVVGTRSCSKYKPK